MQMFLLVYVQLQVSSELTYMVDILANILAKESKV